MVEDTDVDVGDLVGSVDLVLIGASDPAAMTSFTRQCREHKIPFAADTSWQLARMDGEEVRDLVDGAAYLFCNEYEAKLTERKSGWADEEVTARVGVRVTTLGAAGARVDRAGEQPILVPALTDVRPKEATGAGDAFRAGFLAATGWGLGLERAAQLGNVIAVNALEAVGPQDYELKPGPLTERFAAAYGPEAAQDLAEHYGLPAPRPPVVAGAAMPRAHRWMGRTAAQRSAVAWRHGRHDGCDEPRACPGLPRAAGAYRGAGADRMDPGSVDAGVCAAARRALPVGGPAGAQIRDALAARAHRGVLRARARLLRDRDHGLGGHGPAGPVLRALGSDHPAAAGGAAVPRAGQAADPGDRVAARARAPDRGRDTQPDGQGPHVPGDHHPGPGDRAVRGVLLAVVRRRVPQRRGARADPPGAHPTGVRVLLA